MLGLYINIFISVLFILPLLNRKTSKDVFVIWGIYFVSNVLALFFDPSTMQGFKFKDQYNSSNFILYGILVFYSLTPLYSIRTNKMRPNIQSYNFNFNEKHFINFIIVGGIFSLLYMLPFALKSIVLGAKEVRNYVLVLDETSVLPANVFTTIAVAFATFSSIYMALFFLSLKSNLKKSKSILLFVVSLTYLVNSLCYMARDGFLFFLIFGLIFIINYWSTYSKKMKKNIILFAVIIISGFTYALVVFTEDRFGSSDNGTMGYIASQPYVFSENVDQRSIVGHENYYGISLRFPLIDKILGNEPKDFERIEQYEWTFGTFLTDFYSINGLFSLFFTTILFIEFFRYQLKNSKQNTMKFLLVFTFYIHFIVSGVFYFRLGNFSGNIFMVIILILILMHKNKVNKWNFQS